MDFAKITSFLEGNVFPPILNGRAIATILVGSTPGGMASCSNQSPRLGCTTENSHNFTGLETGGLVWTDETPIQGETQDFTTKFSLDQVIAPVITQKRSQRLL